MEHLRQQRCIAIAIPCHRVIGANAKLTSYSGGLERKRRLLQHRGTNLAKSRSETMQ